MKTITAEAIRLRIRDNLLIPATRSRRRSELLVDDFTIISNNCWGGTVYESYGLRKQTPTVGMYIMPTDYLTLVADLDAVLAKPLEFIHPSESKWQDKLSRTRDWGEYPIGLVGEVELHMLHYRDQEVARRKWESRLSRINPDRIVYKFNDQNGCTGSHMREWENLNLPNKIFFAAQDAPGISSAVRVTRSPKHRYVPASLEPVGRSRRFDVTAFLNGQLGAAEV